MKTFNVLIFLCVILALEIYLSSKCDQYQKNNKYIKQCGSNNIYDLGFSLLPKLDTKYSFIDDVLTVIPFIANIYYKTKLHELLMLIIIVRIIRLICMNVTILPPPNNKCNEIIKYKEKSFPYIKFLAGRCNETVFSAHTSLTILSILFLLPLFKDFMKNILYLYAVLVSLIIICLRNHYTIDVILAWTISILTYIVYYKNKNINRLLPSYLL